MQGALYVALVALALWVCARPVIAPVLSLLLEGMGDGCVGGQCGRAQVTVLLLLAFCGALLGLYMLGMVSAYFPDSQMVSSSIARGVIYHGWAAC